ncbi:hypothetical protein Tco_0123766 [Tanacetum coccineum]
MLTGDGTGHFVFGVGLTRIPIGSQPQAIFLETRTAVQRIWKRKKLFDFSDIPSFSLGFTQEDYDMEAETRKEVEKMDEKGVEAFSSRKSEIRFNIDREENRVKARQDPLDVVPLNFFSPTNEVMVCGRRAVTLTDHMKSPFYVRVVNVDKVGKHVREEKVANIFDVLFETKYGQQSSRGQIETLGPQEPVDGNVLSSWSVYLNFMEEKKDSISPAILFFPTFEVVFILVSNVQQKFLLCVSLKNPAVTLIDSKKEGYKVTRKKKKNDDIDDMRVALILPAPVCYKPCKSSSNYRMSDCACDIGKWKCGLDVEGKKHNTQLGHLRNKYAAKLLLSDCNIYKDKIREEMDGK